MIKLFSIIIPLVFININSVFAEITTDGSLGIQVTIAASNNQIVVDESVGKKSGNNLFHSFSEFSIADGQSVDFSGSANITNIISRVTGDSPSVINGEIASSIVGADLWLLNSQGIIFGENASLDISGAFVGTTANNLMFSNGTIFSVDYDRQIDQVEVLPTSTPESLVFTSNSFVGIIMDRTELAFSDGSDFSLVSNKISLSSVKLNSNLSNMQLVSVSNNTQIDLNSLSEMEFGEVDYGDVTIIDSQISIQSSQNQKLSLRANNLKIVNSDILSIGSEVETIDIEATSFVSIRSTLPEESRFSGEDVIKEVADYSFILSASFKNQNNQRVENSAISQNMLSLSEQSTSSHLIDSASKHFFNGKLKNNNREVSYQHETGSTKLKSQCDNESTDLSLITTDESYTAMADPADFHPGTMYASLDIGHLESKKLSIKHHFNACSLSKT